MIIGGGKYIAPRFDPEQIEAWIFIQRLSEAARVSSISFEMKSLASRETCTQADRSDHIVLHHGELGRTIERTPPRTGRSVKLERRVPEEI